MRHALLFRAPPVVALAAALCSARPAWPASDEKAFAEVKARYEKAAKKHDDDGTRDRRRIIPEFADFLDQKACRKFLHEVFDNEDSADTRIAAVQVLGASGDGKDLDWIVKGLTKDRLRGTTIAVAEGLARTAKEAASPAAVHAAELAVKAKGDLRISLLEGVGELAAPAAYDGLVALGDKLLIEERFIRDVALGACGKEKAVATLTLDAKQANAVTRFGAVLGLARTDAKESLAPLVDALRDLDPRVVEAAATAIGAAKHQPAVGALVDAMAGAPLRVKCVLRATLVAMLGKDFGLDAASWRAFVDGAKPPPTPVPADKPKLAEFFGIPVASDRVVVVLDASYRTQYNDRLGRSQQGIAEYLGEIDDATSFDVYSCSQNTGRFAGQMCSGAASRGAATAWVRKQLHSGGFDLKSTLSQILDEQPECDTILLATQSAPRGENATETALETMEVFRRANLTRRVRLNVAFVAPGGRLTTSESEDEFEDRAKLMQLMAETSGGKFVRIDR